MTDHLMAPVAAALREAAAKAVLPRFRQLAAHDIVEKSPGEIVTAADREAEDILAESLTRLLPGSRAVGEEAASADPVLMERLSEGPVWLIDPVDGTASFARGLEAFGMMVALLHDGDIIGSWMLQPLRDRMFTARRGGGAFVDGRSVRAVDGVSSRSALVGSVLRRFLPDELKSRIDAAAPGFREIRSGQLCVAFDYPDVVEGRHDFVLYGRTLPWDHAAAALFVEEAGGVVRRFDGRAYRLIEPGFGLIVARNRDVLGEVQRAIFA